MFVWLLSLEKSEIRQNLAKINEMFPYSFSQTFCSRIRWFVDDECFSCSGWFSTNKQILANVFISTLLFSKSESLQIGGIKSQEKLFKPWLFSWKAKINLNSGLVFLPTRQNFFSGAIENSRQLLRKKKIHVRN